jgi:hypothetical protein
MILGLRHALETAGSLLLIGPGPRRLPVLALSGAFVPGSIGHDIVGISLVMVVSPARQRCHFFEVKSETGQLLLEVAPEGHYKGGATGYLSDCFFLEGKHGVRVDLRLIVPDTQLPRYVRAPSPEAARDVNGRTQCRVADAHILHLG